MSGQAWNVGLVVALAAGSAWASPGLQAQVPNSDKFDCNLCHTAGPGSPLNTFGNKIGATRSAPDTIDWSAVFNADCDQDDYTNGEELGDADGDQVADPSFAATHPFDDSDFPCGNNTVEGPELCDGNLLNGETCQTIGSGDGTLGCATNCRSWDTTACTTCGDSVIDPGEACDNGATNSDSQPGACRSNCTPPRCGDGVVDPGEMCEPSLDASCSITCSLETCGNGVVDAGELCDDGGANSGTTPDACRLTCVPAWCGDAVVDNGEECERATDVACGNDCTWSRCPDGSLNTNGYCGDGPSRAGEEENDTQTDGLMVGSSYGCAATPAAWLASCSWLLALALTGRPKRR